MPENPTNGANVTNRNRALSEKLKIRASVASAGNRVARQCLIVAQACSIPMNNRMTRNGITGSR